MSVTILQGDCREKVTGLPPVHAVVTDPPYHIGFMGKAWDGGDVALRADTWAKIAGAMLPGAHLVAFGGTRTFHRLAVAIEDAGLELRDTLMWVYGSGFPKSSNQHDQWEGWGTALKPAWEPIILARKPLEGTVSQNLAKYRTGAINIADCRVPSEGGAARKGEASQDRRYDERGSTNFAAKPGPRGGAPEGRWPANLLYDGSADVLDAFPDSAGQQGDLIGHSRQRKSKGIYGDLPAARNAIARRDNGSAARFFYCAKASRADRNDGLEGMPEKPLLWSAGDKNPGSFQAEGTKKAAQNNHPTVKPTTLMRWLCRLVTPPGGQVLDPFMGSGSTGRGAVMEGFDFVGVEQDASYIEIARRRIAAVVPDMSNLGSMLE